MCPDIGPFLAARDGQKAAPAALGVFHDDTTPVHDALLLTAGGAVAHILLHGQVYALRITRAGKLILTK